MTAKSILLGLLAQSFNRPAWHGPNLRNSLRGVSAAQAAWRPGRGRHNIWEITLHAAYWKYVGVRRLLGGEVEPFPHSGTNWFRSPSRPDGKAWRDTLALLEHMHKEVLRAVEKVPEEDLEKPARGSKQANLEIIVGVASHDLYHAGQIRLLRRLLPG